jgi:hypothetical protein
MSSAVSGRTQFGISGRYFLRSFAPGISWDFILLGKIGFPTMTSYRINLKKKKGIYGTSRGDIQGVVTRSGTFLRIIGH